MNEPAQHPDDALRDIGQTARALAPGELQRLLAHVARAEFPPRLQAIARIGQGLSYGGRILRAGDVLPTDEQHYVKHVLAQQEWPAGTTRAQYLDSIREVILDPTSGVLVNLYSGRAWHLTILRRSGSLRGPKSGGWVLVDYAVGSSASPGHLLTVFQVADGPRYVTISALRRQQQRWLRSWT
jgi:hypothetical protein